MNPSFILTPWDNLGQHHQEKSLTCKTGNKDGNVVSCHLEQSTYQQLKGNPCEGNLSVKPKKYLEEDTSVPVLSSENSQMPNVD